MARKTSAPAGAGPDPHEAWIASRRGWIDRALREDLPPRPAPAAKIQEAMAWALLGPGKRMRPLLTLAVGEMYRVDRSVLIPPACAIEMVHAASLILDDLPCMDDASERRGRPACHVAWGEATAILAAVALLNEAFSVLSRPDRVAPRLGGTLVRLLGTAIGLEGIIGGQGADLALGDPGAPGAEGDLASLEFIHRRKTGSLFIVAAEFGARCGGATAGERAALTSFARDLGLAFQITDALIDATGDAAAAGKPVRRDPDRVSFVTLCGVEGSRALARELVDTAVAALDPFGRRAGRIRAFARDIADRER